MTIGERIRWMGGIPEKCDLCGKKIRGSEKVFYDAAISENGPWGNICSSCFSEIGGQLGLGKGQKYDAKTGVQLSGGSGRIQPEEW